MGFCIDRSTRYLRNQGYNVVRHPADGLRPLDIFGRIKGVPTMVGTLEDLLDNPTVNLPPIRDGLTAANINGKRTSKLPIQASFDILGSILSSLGADVGVAAKFENAKKLQFQFNNVEKSNVSLAKIGDYIEGGDIKWDSMGIREFLSPGGTLYVVTETVQSSNFGVTAFESNKAEMKLDVPAIQGLLGNGSVSVSAEAEQSSDVTFAGEKKLVFGFSCVELAVSEDPDDDEELRLSFKPTDAGDVTLGNQRTDATPAILEENGLIEGLPRQAP